MIKYARWRPPPPQTMSTIEMVNKVWICNPIFFLSNTSFWCPLLDLHLSTHHSIIDSRLRWVTKLRLVYTMDHEVVPRPCKIVIGSWTRLKTTSIYTKGKNVKVTMEFEVPKRHILWLTWFNMFCGGRGKISALVEKGKGPWQRIFVVIMKF